MVLLAVIEQLSDKRLLVVTGKGGVGKSTLAAALAVQSAREARRTLVCEVNAKERISQLLGLPEVGPEITAIDENLWAVNVRPQEAMREYALKAQQRQSFERLGELGGGRTSRSWSAKTLPIRSASARMGPRRTGSSRPSAMSISASRSPASLEAAETKHPRTMCSVPGVELEIESVVEGGISLGSGPASVIVKPTGPNARSLLREFVAA